MLGKESVSYSSPRTQAPPWTLVGRAKAELAARARTAKYCLNCMMGSEKVFVNEIWKYWTVGNVDEASGRFLRIEGVGDDR